MQAVTPEGIGIVLCLCQCALLWERVRDQTVHPCTMGSTSPHPVPAGPSLCSILLPTQLPCHFSIHMGLAASLFFFAHVTKIHEWAECHPRNHDARMGLPTISPGPPSLCRSFLLLPHQLLVPVRTEAVRSFHPHIPCNSPLCSSIPAGDLASKIRETQRPPGSSF